MFAKTCVGVLEQKDLHQPPRKEIGIPVGHASGYARNRGRPRTKSLNSAQSVFAMQLFNAGARRVPILITNRPALKKRGYLYDMLVVFFEDLKNNNQRLICKR